MESKTRKNAREAVEYLRSIINSFEKTDFIDGDATKCCNEEKLQKFNEASKVFRKAIDELQDESDKSN